MKNNNADDPPRLTLAQSNLLDDLTKHKIEQLNHKSLATLFSQLADSGLIFPPFTKPHIELRDERYFSAGTKALFDEVTGRFQQDICRVLSRHQNEMAEQSDVMVKSRLKTFSDIFKNRKLTKHIDDLSKERSIEEFSNNLVRNDRRRAGDKRPRQ